MLNATEGAHLKNMSTFEADEYLQELTPLPSAEVEGAGGQSEVKRGRLRYMLRGSVLVRATKALTMLKRKPALRADRAKGSLVIATSFSRFRWQVVPAGFTAFGRGAHENAPHPAQLSAAA